MKADVVAIVGGWPCLSVIPEERGQLGRVVVRSWWGTLLSEHVSEERALDELLQLVVRARLLGRATSASFVVACPQYLSCLWQVWDESWLHGPILGPS